MTVATRNRKNRGKAVRLSTGHEMIGDVCNMLGHYVSVSLSYPVGRQCLSLSNLRNLSASHITAANGPMMWLSRPAIESNNTSIATP
jgi:hypothetical protein